MNDPPPDPPRLPAILGYPEQQLAHEETVVTYLRLQVAVVRHALAAAENRKAANFAPPSSHRPSATRPELGPVPTELEILD